MKDGKVAVGPAERRIRGWRAAPAVESLGAGTEAQVLFPRVDVVRGEEIP